MPLKDLYKQTLLDHYRRPRNKKNLKDADCTIERENPACGDRLKLQVELDQEGTLRNIFFDGEGCAISIASASMMTEFVKGKKAKELFGLIDTFIRTMRGELNLEKLKKFDELSALNEVVGYPLRVKCATLGWCALLEALKKLSS